MGGLCKPELLWESLVGWLCKPEFPEARVRVKTLAIELGLRTSCGRAL